MKQQAKEIKGAICKSQRDYRRNKPGGINFGTNSMTEQSHAKSCDINVIMQKYQKSGVLDHVNKHQENYGFCTSADLHESLNQIKTAQEMFDDLPSKARTKFNNDPAQFLDFVQDPENEAQLFDLGLSDYPLEEHIPEDKTSKETPPAEATAE